ncbi:hypothetical protein GCM10025790_10740 [Nesterenkonia rhizosphaerae]|uniref:Uncharacterized protein n=1 Tax=Nesterenkonia rhizosphaerae TaxID=1348272 RepID=A0ABP9FUT2_9MICC
MAAQGLQAAAQFLGVVFDWDDHADLRPADCLRDIIYLHSRSLQRLTRASSSYAPGITSL